MDTQLEKALANYDMIMGRTGSLYDELEPLRDVAFRFQEMMMIYKAAIREVRTKLEVLNDEFQVRSKRNPIRYIKQRVKRPNSILEKLHRRGFEISLDSMIKNLNDLNKFKNSLKEINAKPLSALTNGVHLHTISADSVENMELIKDELKENNFIL